MRILQNNYHSLCLIASLKKIFHTKIQHNILILPTLLPPNSNFVLPFVETKKPLHPIKYCLMITFDTTFSTEMSFLLRISVKIMKL